MGPELATGCKEASEAVISMLPGGGGDLPQLTKVPPTGASLEATATQVLVSP